MCVLEYKENTKFAVLLLHYFSCTVNWQKYVFLSSRESQITLSQKTSCVFSSYKQNEYSHAAATSSPAVPKRPVENTFPTLPFHLSCKYPPPIGNPMCSAIKFSWTPLYKVDAAIMWFEEKTVCTSNLKGPHRRTF